MTSGPYLHITNLRTPLDPTDLGFLALLDDYRLGPPSPAVARPNVTPYSLEELQQMGIIGLYMPEEEFSRPEVRKRTGWTTKTWRARQAKGAAWPLSDPSSGPIPPPASG